MTSMEITSGISSTLQEIFVMNVILIYDRLSKVFDLFLIFT